MSKTYIVTLTTLALIVILAATTYTILETQGLNPQPDQLPLGPFSYRGKLEQKIFPVNRFGPAPAIGDSQEYMDLEVLTADQRYENQTAPLYIRTGGRTEMLLANSGGNGVVCGLTIDEINDAYKSGDEFEIVGNVHTLIREGRIYRVLELSSLKIINPTELPLVIYSLKNVTGVSGYQINGRVETPQSFNVSTVTLGGVTQVEKQIYQVLLNEGDAIAYSVNSTRPIDLQITFTQQNTVNNQSGSDWYTANSVTSVRYGLVSFERGLYSFIVSPSTQNPAKVTLNIWRIGWNPSEVLFKSSGGASSAFGGVGWFSFYLEPLPRSFVVGRTWYNDSWTDKSLSFSTKLKAGAKIEYEYNATQPIMFAFSGNGDSKSNLYSYSSKFTAPSSGEYSFSFDVPQGTTSIVSFRCTVANTSMIDYSDGGYAALLFDTQPTELKLSYPFPPEVNSETTITGKLRASQYPGIGTVMTIISTDGSEYFLHLGTPSEYLMVPAHGYTRLGNATLFDVNEAYVNNSTVSVTGFQYEVKVDGQAYPILHVNSLDILGSRRLYAKQSMEIVSGFQYFGQDSEEIEYFPISFGLGFDHYSWSNESIFGNMERYFAVYLEPGERIKITFNASEPVEFGVYFNSYSPDSPGVMGFDNSKPGDYMLRGSGVGTYDKVMEVSSRGYYSFAFKAFGGVKSSVNFDLTLIS